MDEIKSKTVLMEELDSVALITLNRPEALNSLDTELSERLYEVLEMVDMRDDIRVVVLTGSGRNFCAGGDINTMKAFQNTVDAYDFLSKAARAVLKITEMKKPVIGMINGAAAGAGFNIALACDLIFAAENTRFLQNFAKVGLVPDMGGHYLLVRAVGPQKAKELMFTGRAVTADEGKALGFVNEIFEINDLREETLKYAKELAKAAPLALSGIKNIINRSYEMDLRAVQELEINLQSRLMLTKDCKEGLGAFLEKRSPDFQGK